MRILIPLIVLTLTTPTLAAIQMKEVRYTHGGVEFIGHVAFDDAIEGESPGVLVVHEWWGCNDYAKHRAAMLAEMGYVAFACDMYGSGKTAADAKQASEMSNVLKNDTKLWRARANAALEQLRAQPQVDKKRIAAIGYCFGGSTVLQLAYSGADLAAVVSFHGSLPVPTAEEAKAIKAKVLVCHGAEDTFIPADQIAAMQKALTEGGADWQMIYYAHAVHSFTNPDSGKAGIKGVAYNEKADRRSWMDMEQLFIEVFTVEEE